jgi:hypothetical protein
MPYLGRRRQRRGSVSEKLQQVPQEFFRMRMQIGEAGKVKQHLPRS